MAGGILFPAVMGDGSVFPVRGMPKHLLPIRFPGDKRKPSDWVGRRRVSSDVEYLAVRRMTSENTTETVGLRPGLCVVAQSVGEVRYTFGVHGCGRWLL